MYFSEVELFQKLFDMRRHLLVLCYTWGHFLVLEKLEQVTMDSFGLKIFYYLNDPNNEDGMSMWNRAAYLLTQVLHLIYDPDAIDCLWKMQKEKKRYALFVYFHLMNCSWVEGIEEWKSLDFFYYLLCIALLLHCELSFDGGSLDLSFPFYVLNTHHHCQISQNMN